jgi:hypothetical protein
MGRTSGRTRATPQASSGAIPKSHTKLLFTLSSPLGSLLSRSFTLLLDHWTAPGHLIGPKLNSSEWSHDFPSQTHYSSRILHLHSDLSIHSDLSQAISSPPPYLCPPSLPHTQLIHVLVSQFGRGTPISTQSLP